MRYLSRLFSVALVFVLSLTFVVRVSAADVTISIEDSSFVPDSVSITAGDTVTWVNNDTINHTATDDDSAWDTGVIEPGESVSVVFTTPGTANYHCELHPTMTGTVVVASAAQSSGTSSGVGGGSTATGSSQPVSGISGPTLAMLAMGLGLIGFGVVFYKKAKVLV